LPPGEVQVEVLEMLFQVVEGLTLGPVIRVILKIAQPGPVFFPVDDLGGNPGRIL
jgi:hypothetical protein